MNDETLVAMVTGAASGIGEASAIALAKRGYRVVIADVREDAANRVAQCMKVQGYEALAVTVDVADEHSVRNMVERVIFAWRRIDVLINSAGLESCSPFLDIALSEFKRVMDVNTTGTWLCCQEVLPHMLRQQHGAIVNISSIAGQKGGGLLGTAAYATSKGAVIAMTKSLAREFARSGVRINAVAPAFTITDFVKRQLEKKAPGFIDTIMALTPMGRGAQPSEIAAVIAFLASEEASFVTGHVYNADGGTAI